MERILNLGVLAHIDAGKTTTVEQLLYLAGALRAPGSVDAGNTQTDWLPIERERGISVRSSTAGMVYGGVRINLIDTPGHMDFTGEVERALSVLDAAVLVVSAAEGIQSQTERFWGALRALQLPCVVFVNKVDRTGCDPAQVLAALRAELSPAIIPLNRVENAGLPGCHVEEAEPDEDALLRLCDVDDPLAERYLEGEQIPPAALGEALRRAAAAGRAFPLVYGAAAQGLGTAALLSAVAEFLPPVDEAPQGEVCGVVYKIEHDKAMGKIAHVRLYQGTLRNREAVALHRPGLEAPLPGKVTQIRRVAGERREDAGLLTGGNIAAVYGLADAKTGDWLGRVRQRAVPRLAVPLFAVQLFAPEGRLTQLLQAVEELADEDPLMGYDWDPDARELVVRVMGKIQLEVLERLLMERYDLAVRLSPPSVIYKETPAGRGVGLERYTMPKPCWAVVKLQVDPLPRGSGYQYESVVKDRDLFGRYQAHVATTVPQALQQGMMGWEVTDLKVTLIGGEHHTIHTHPLDFFLATPIAVMKALQDSGTLLLEPLLSLRLTADEGLAGRVMGDIIAMRGSFDSPVVKGGRAHLEALVPVAESMDYYERFASLTGGRGAYRAGFAGYQECPPQLGKTARRRGVNPLDRDKWILHKRGAL